MEDYPVPERLLFVPEVVRRLKTLDPFLLGAFKLVATHDPLEVHLVLYTRPIGKGRNGFRELIRRELAEQNVDAPRIRMLRGMIVVEMMLKTVLPTRPAGVVVPP